MIVYVKSNNVIFALKMLANDTIEKMTQWQLSNTHKTCQRGSVPHKNVLYSMIPRFIPRRMSHKQLR